MAHLRAQRPWNCEVDVQKVKVGHAFAVDESHPAIVAAEAALEEAYGAPVENIGSGASIPLVASLKKVSPDAAILLWGAEDTAQSRIHASDESVDPAEIERMIVGKSEYDLPVALGPPWNSVSPVNTTPRSGAYSDVLPGEWPGVWSACSWTPATSKTCPSASSLSGPTSG